MNFNPESIDFLKTYRNIRVKNPRCGRISRVSFGAPVVRMADAVITTYFDKASIKGVKKCLEYEIKRVSWRDYIWIIPLSKHTPFDPADRDTLSLLAESLILTIIAYRIQLNERSSGLSHIVFNEIIQGFEWVCYWESRCIKLKSSENELIAVHDIEHLKQFIPEK